MNAILEALGNLGFDWHVALANLVNFLIIFFVLKYFFFGKIQAILRERKSVIEKGIEKAEESTRRLRDAEEEKKAIVAGAQQEADAIIEQAGIAAKASAREIVQEADKTAAQHIAHAEKAQMRLEAEYERELKERVPKLALSMVEKVLQEKMTEEENTRYIKKLLSQ